MASTLAGTDTKTGELTVEGIPPQIIVEPSDRVRLGLHLSWRVANFALSYRRSVSFQIVTEGTRIVLPCTAKGVPEPTHVWFNVSCLLLDFLPSKMLHENMPPAVNGLRIHWST